MRKVLICILSFYLGNSVVLADTVTAKLTFEKRPPKVAVLFEPKVKYSEVKGEIDQKEKKFSSMIVVATPKSKLNFKNSDVFDHNIYANDLDNNVQFDVGLMAVGAKSSVEVDWTNSTLVRIGCKIHPKMRAYIANLPSDNFSVAEMSKKDRVVSLEIKKIKKTAKTFELLMPKYEAVKVNLRKGESKTMDLLKKGKKRGSVTLTRS